MYSAVTEQPIRVDYVIFNGLIYRLAQTPTVNQATFARRSAIFLKGVKNQLNPIDYGREPTSSRSILSHRPSQQRTTLSLAIPDIFSIPWPDASFQPAPPSMTFPGDRDKDVPQLQGSQDIKKPLAAFCRCSPRIPNPLNDPQGHLSDTFHHPILSADVPHIESQPHLKGPLFLFNDFVLRNAFNDEVSSFPNTWRCDSLREEPLSHSLNEATWA
ncbi:hypothetical protein L210DRAFT_1061514, partial [Boletus edulis BED1]